MATPTTQRSVSRGDRHLAGLDLLRFFAALMVMLFHLAYLDWALPGSTAFRLSGGAVSFPELSSITSFGWLGVQIFFVISGFVIAYSAEQASLFSFARSRVLRLFPAAWICASLSFVAINLSTSGPMPLSVYGHSLLLWPWGPWVDPSFWTLGVEVFFYGLVAFLIAMGRFTAIRSLALLLGSVSAIYWLSWWLSFMDASGALHQWLLRYRESRLLELLLVQHGCFFALGVMLWSLLIKRSSLVGWILACSMALVCLLQIAAHHALAAEKTGLLTESWLPLAVWLAAIGWMVFSIRYSHRLEMGFAWRNAFRRIGLMTYPLYLIHQVLGCLMLGWLVAAGVNRFIALGASILALLVLSHLICSVFELPLRAVLRRGFSIVDRYVYY